VTPRKLGHVVIGSTDQAATQRFFTEGIGFKISDSVPSMAAFMRCSTDHHNVLVQQAPVNFLHHTSWQVEDVDEIGRGAMAMLEDHPDRHIWGPPPPPSSDRENRVVYPRVEHSGGTHAGGGGASCTGGACSTRGASCTGGACRTGCGGAGGS
jgi:hypothetical protein